MSPLDVVILVIAIGATVFGIVVTIRQRKQGKGCSGNCAACGGCCHLDNKEKDE